MDTPVNDEVSLELIDWVEHKTEGEIKGLIVHHFHEDCLGGIRPFHEKGIPTFGNRETVELANLNGVEPPKTGFTEELVLSVGRGHVVSKFYGKGHTSDNIVSYLPKEKVLFGGCLIKSVGAGKGNLADADSSACSQTVSTIKATYPDLKYVVPGHGKVGGPELLDFTIELFKQE